MEIGIGFVLLPSSSLVQLSLSCLRMGLIRVFTSIMNK